ncbi:MAG: Ribosomal RNA large subunit methyltransferase H [Thermocaproicibacter melissae]|jgi:23S rRNA (pseudouridine1915-N3)-methyltransferase|uniref:23S rRNA (pseudouridine(1915)-N(3))-methyltransferase RlmH n=1 Tax=Thermocaproicibacter melissae TaxID=2966552 RepID=UPI0024B1A43C|nr:23S rRNA (pseudouridine(1915)-N(3))-methyltransferase RlmH [Thermocaproicibacter melissae]WBY64801.1 23S rRNA (pseudouridine(1915)-N(3))-methyltransferase RlmH [Thermocaproicibacter melissae]
MMKLHLICVGKLKESYWRDAFAEYEKRLGQFCNFSLTELPECRLPSDPSAAQIAAALEKEGEWIEKASTGSKVIALCIEGKQFSSVEFAEKMESYGVQGYGSIDFIIGSSFGLSQRVKEKADLRISFSPMTFPHQLARVMLMEQIYRAFQIINHGKYHK